MHFKINWVSLVGSKFTVFALFYFVFEGNFPSTSPQEGGAYIWKGDLTEDFLHYLFGGGGGIFGGAYFRNFTVFDFPLSSFNYLLKKNYVDTVRQ